MFRSNAYHGIKTRKFISSVDQIPVLMHLHHALPFTAMLLLSSCGSILMGVKKPLIMVDAPKDLQVKNKHTGEQLAVESVQWGGKRSAASNTATFYYAPGVRFKPHRATMLELSTGEGAVTVPIGKKNMTGILILDIAISWGVFAIIDLANGGVRRHRPRYVDVPAVLAGRPQRSEEELQNYLEMNSQ